MVRVGPVLTRLTRLTPRALKHESAGDSSTTQPVLEPDLAARASGELRVVGDHDDRSSVLADEAREDLEDPLRVLRVEIPRRLVGENERRIVGDRARDRDALLLPARELPRLAVIELGEVEHPEHLVAVILGLRSARCALAGGLGG